MNKNPAVANTTSLQNHPIRRYLDRRIKSRHKAETLSVMATPVRLLRLPGRTLHFSCVDFNRYGMAIESTQALKKGQRLLFRFRGQYIYENGIEGEITSAKKEHGIHRYGVAFVYAESAKSYSREVDNALSRIEGIFSQMSRND